MISVSPWSVKHKLCRVLSSRSLTEGDLLDSKCQDPVLRQPAKLLAALTIARRCNLPVRILTDFSNSLESAVKFRGQ